MWPRWRLVLARSLGRDEQPGTLAYPAVEAERALDRLEDAHEGRIGGDAERHPHEAFHVDQTEAGCLKRASIPGRSRNVIMNSGSYLVKSVAPTADLQIKSRSASHPL